MVGRRGTCDTCQPTTVKGGQRNVRELFYGLFLGEPADIDDLLVLFP